MSLCVAPASERGALSAPLSGAQGAFPQVRDPELAGPHGWDAHPHQRRSLWASVHTQVVSQCGLGIIEVSREWSLPRGAPQGAYQPHGWGFVGCDGRKPVARSIWFDAVGWASRHWRELKACRWEAMGRQREREARARARRAEERARAEGHPHASQPYKPGEASYWHRARAKGIREVMERAKRCGEDAVLGVRCASCGDERCNMPLVCSVRFVCVRCRGKIARLRRQAFDAAVAELMPAAAAAGMLRKGAPGGAWSQKLLTLTVPHASPDPAERVELLFRALERFGAKLRDYVFERVTGVTRSRWYKSRSCKHTHRKKQRDSCSTRSGSPAPAPALQRRAIGRIRSWVKGEPERLLELQREPWRWLEYVRVVEWTPGADGLGHPHAHVWLFSPYLDRDWLLEAWGECLRAAGVRFDGDPVVDVRRVRRAKSKDYKVPDGRGGWADVSRELFKYLTKDIAVTDDSGGRPVLVDPAVFSEAWRALSAHRLAQTSRNFGRWVLEVVHSCEGCGCLEWFVEIRDLEVYDLWSDPPRGRGPPADFACERVRNPEKTR